MSNEDETYRKIILPRDNAPRLAFMGSEIATVRSDWSHGYQHELALYRTRGNRYICQRVTRTQWQGDHDRFAVEVVDDGNGIMRYFGHGLLAKELYAEAGMEDVEEFEFTG